MTWYTWSVGGLGVLGVVFGLGHKAAQRAAIVGRNVLDYST